MPPDALLALVGLGAGLPATGAFGVVAERVARLVAESLGGHAVDLAVVDARVARLVGAPAPRGTVASSVRRWRRARAWAPERSDGFAVVPLADGDRLLGVLRLAVPGSVGDAALALLGARAGEVLARVVDDARHAEADAVAAATSHRDRVARGLAAAVARHLDTALPVLRDIGPLPPEAALRVATARAAVARAAAEAEQSAAVLDLLGGRGLLGALREVVRELGADGADVELRLTGRVRDVSPEPAEALLRVARAAAVSAVRHGRADVVSLALAYADGSVSVAVRDNGAGPSARADAGLVFGLRLMRRRLAELGGGVEVAPARPTGAHVRAWVRA
jgi:signal transduction histidine kinase